MQRLIARGDNFLRKRSFTYVRFSAMRKFLHQIDQTKPPLIVYQMGKVGSSSVVATLNAVAPDYQIFQIHTFSREWVAKQEQQYRQAAGFHGTYSIDNHVIASSYLLDRRERRPAGERWKYISLVRDPVARNISAFFQAYPIYFAAKTSGYNDTEVNSKPVQELEREFVEEFGEWRHKMPTVWYQSFIEPTLGIDVFSVPFDRERGYQIYHGPDADLLLLRFEDLNQKLPAALDAFLGVSANSVQKANISSEKGYAETYGAFKTNLALPESYLDTLYESAFARHFYSQEELAAFRRRWTR